MEKKVIDQKEYLRKYLSTDVDKKKKKKKLKVGSKTVKIIDDDIDLKNMRPIDDSEFDIFIDSEDAPQIAGIVDEVRQHSFRDEKKWKIVANSDDGDITFTRNDREQSKNNSDLSPLRKSKKHKRETGSPPRKHAKDSDLDLSPPRRHKKDSDLDLSPPRKHKKDSDLDLSPPRKHKKDSDLDLSPPRKHKKDSDLDLSPPRKHKKHSGLDLSPRRKRRKDSDSDSTPPRKSRKDLSPHRRRKKDSDADLSPPRQSRKDKSSQVNSKYREKSDDSSCSPPRRSKKHKKSRSGSHRAEKNEDSDLSPPRRSARDVDTHGTDKTHKYSDECYSKSKRKHNSESSPPRRQRESHRDGSTSHKSRDRRKDDYDRYERDKRKSKHRHDSMYKTDESARNSRGRERPSRWETENGETESKQKDNVENTGERMKWTLDGKVAGLQDAKALREETEAFKKREAEQFKKLSKEVSGVGQAAIVRDSKTGRKRNLEAEAAEEREKQKRQDELDEKYAKWGKGLKQVQDHEEKLKDDLYEMSKPLARYADDADLDKQLREQEREGDPMLEYIKQKQIKEGKRKPDALVYKGSYMPNRFGIKPGHRWDGVDRSNGYEKKWFEAQNSKLARHEEAYKWSTSDM